MGISVYGMKPQTKRVLAELLFWGDRGISKARAQAFAGVENLSARISELREHGADIVTVPQVTNQKASHYVLVG